jgi:hypothetical protein
MVRSFPGAIKDERTKRGCAMTVRQFLKFYRGAPPSLIVGDNFTKPPAEGLPETALPQQWLLEKLVDEKTRSDDLTRTLGGKLMNHYIFFKVA